MASLYNQVPSVSAVFSLYASFSAIMMLFRTVINEIVPKGIRDYITVRFVDFFSSYFQFESSFTFVIEQKWGSVDNQTFRAAEAYLPTCLAGLSTEKLVVGCNLKNPSDQISSNSNRGSSGSAPTWNPAGQLKLGVPVDTKIIDEFEGIHLEWTLHSTVMETYPYEKRYFHLTCKKKFREKIMTDCFTHFVKSAQKRMSHRENLNIYTYNQQHSYWEPAIFEHHATFETLAIEPKLKTTMIDDLDAFSKGKDFFKSVGRAWKRGYLLYGPPGTGKSSMVAAIANYMNYHIYDLQLQSVSNDGQLRKILTTTQNRSIILIEDIDCGSDASSIRKTKGKEQVSSTSEGISLSGLLNFVDGLWSCCAEERIIIFTTNHKEKLDPALLRPGRMDIHILMDYCTTFVFKKLVAMYLKIDDHALIDPIEELVLEVSVTPAEVTQQLMVSKNADVALKGLLELLETKKMRKEDDAKVEDEGEIEEAET
ncbi:unnamed protein product [Microthlaspi erraticum]|uniref:AAA+ ATPase domain-containing protein n=1 Tax=Microthlaspi erraticum TaxID=1685480 RepID=A0A6D2I762_9BRAS|nr:unnamed protein product [Microthlaspi erraticum]